MRSLEFGDSTRFLESEATEAASEILKNIIDGIVTVGALLHVPWILTIVEFIYFAGLM
jgi:hypothetical protein